MKTLPKKRLEKNDGQRILNNCLTIMNAAIKRRISVHRASKLFGLGKNYVSEIKTSLDDRLASGRFNKRQYTEFVRAYKQYQKTVR